jgi:putative phosphonate metabolism protein
LSLRVALYWAPEVGDPLHEAGSRWLGRDAETGAAVPQPDGVPDIAGITADARLYGLHATLKPPFRPTAPYAEVAGAARALAGGLAPFDLPPLGVRDLEGFLALRETAPCPALRALADSCVEGLDALRAPPDEAELARRRKAGLSAEQEENLLRWGYPYVFGAWRFHVTLTRRLADGEREAVAAAAEREVGAAAARPRRVTEICLFTQAGRGQPFLIAERLPLLRGRPA